MYERELLQQEKAKPTQKFLGYYFYHDPLRLKDGTSEQLTNIFSRAETYSAFSGEKKCGGFHPDYALVWGNDAEKMLVLVCFGCGELKTGGPEGTSRHDMGSTHDDIEKILKQFRENRPESRNQK